ncbi:hypothetical protein LNKW23_43330 [Paralimibaculum aggregatum]|uniref:Adenylate cyclase n=1 Tax=Paralimibaculum aggregatum TaxID=3036245 RepID=A0ABQ6LSS2_9RHOB|nr:hypothetical protein [Limibaculum sp. NKW23]GMG85117.1 hypothetical protein LNKW23_43330 [Limibaculum sp. NKW23]
MTNPEFTATERRRAFLHFIVEERLAGRARELKGFTIANAVFGRDETFDPKTDPVVRLEARRLRRDLDSYYVGPGAGDPVRISIPRGGYVPLFEARGAAAEPESGPAAPDEIAEPGRIPPPARQARRGRGHGWLRVSAAIAAALLVAAGLLAAFLDQASPPEGQPAEALPRIAILPFKALGPSETNLLLSAGLSSELILNLSRFQGLRLYSPVAPGDLEQTLADFRGSPVPAYILRGVVLTEHERASVHVQLVVARTDEIVWGEAYDLQLAPGAIMALRDTLSAEIATAIGQPYGPLNDDIRQQGTGSTLSSLESYFCVMRAHAYRRHFSVEEAVPVRACLDAAVVRNPEYSDAWAMLGWLQLDAARYHFVPPDRRAAEYAAALASAERALALAPGSVLALKALASIHHHIGNYEIGERLGREALSRNPHDPDTLAQVGWRLAARGKFDEGTRLMERAIERTINPPGWYYHMLAIRHLMEGDPRRMLATAEQAVARGSGFGQFLVASAAGTLGDAQKAASALDALSGYPSLAADPADFMRRHGATEAIVETTMAGYLAARRLASRSSPASAPGRD